MNKKKAAAMVMAVRERRVKVKLVLKRMPHFLVWLLNGL